MTTEQDSIPVIEEGRTPPPSAGSSRANREQETRESEEHQQRSWAPVAGLPTPSEQDGYTFRWIRVGMLGEADNTNVSRKFREGWVPVKSSEARELQVISDIDSRFKDNVVIGGLMLCKMPTQMVEQRQAYFDRMNRDQQDAIRNSLFNENDARMPLDSQSMETHTDVEFGRG